VWFKNFIFDGSRCTYVINIISLSFFKYVEVIGVVCKLRHALGRREAEELLTVQIQNFLFFENFMTRGRGGQKVIFLRDVFCDQPLFQCAGIIILEKHSLLN